VQNDTDGKRSSLFSAAACSQNISSAWRTSACVIVGNQHFPAAVIELDAVTKGSQ
jgi:hypothetical protein